MSALREDQLQNAVAFLQHPKVRLSGQEQKRAFLASKGLTDAEIAEAFRRVPDTNAAANTGAPGSAVATLPQPGQPPSNTLVPGAPPPVRLTWSQLLFRMGLLAGGALAAKRALAPYAQPAARSLAAYCGLQPAAVDDAEAEAAAAERERLSELGTRLESTTEEVAQSLEDVKALLRRVERDMARVTPAAAGTPSTPGGEAGATTLTVQALTPAIKDALRDIRDELRAEMRAMSERMQAVAAGQQSGGGGGGTTPLRPESGGTPAGGEQQSSVTRHASTSSSSMDNSGRSPGYSSPWDPPAGGGSAAPLPGVHMNGHSNGVHAAAAAAQPVLSSARGAGAAGAHASGMAAMGQHPAGYMHLLNMVESGRTPPGIREVDDKAPDNSAPPSAPAMRPPSKPWERGASASSSSAAYAYSSAPPSRSGVVLTELATTTGSSAEDSSEVDRFGAGPSTAWTPPPVPVIADNAAARVLGVPTGLAVDEA